jgi:transcriptional regulator with XRE-family HTH domain
LLRLKSLRKLKGYSREFVAEYLGISVYTYKSWEQCKYEPKIEVLIKLSELFNVSIDEMVGNDRPVIKEVKTSEQLFNELYEHMKLEIKNEILGELNKDK